MNTLRLLLVLLCFPLIGYSQPTTESWKKPVLLNKEIVNPRNLVAVGKNIFFTSNELMMYGYNVVLWVTDGTPAGTRKLKVITRQGDSNPKLIALDKYLFFGVSGQNETDTLYRTDGTATGTFALTDSIGKPRGFPREFAFHENKLLFVGAADRWSPSHYEWREFQSTVWETTGKPKSIRKASFTAWAIRNQANQLFVQPEYSGSDGYVLTKEGKVIRYSPPVGWTNFIPKTTIDGKLFGVGMAKSSETSQKVNAKSTVLWGKATESWRINQLKLGTVDSDPYYDPSGYLGAATSDGQMVPLITLPGSSALLKTITNQRQIALLWTEGAAIISDGSQNGTFICDKLFPNEVTEIRGYKDDFYFFQSSHIKTEVEGIAKYRKSSNSIKNGLYRILEGGDTELVDTLSLTSPSPEYPNQLSHNSSSTLIPTVTATPNALYFQNGRDLIRWVAPGNITRIAVPFDYLYPFSVDSEFPNKTAAVLEWPGGLLVAGGNTSKQQPISLYSIAKTK